MQRYEKYKDSGVDWIGEIPEGWFQKPFSSVFSLKSIINNKNKELLSVYLDKGVIRFSDVNEKRTNVTSEDLSKYQLVKEGDFVLNNQQAWRGSVGISFYSGIVSPAYIVLEVKNKFDFNFLNYLLRNRSFVTHYLLCSKGVGTIQRNLYWPQLKRVHLIYPPLNEQQTIATFLDDKTAKIDQTIANKQKEIELLKERRQILIQKAVTKGLDDTVPLKDSGVDWIGEIPEHWEVRNLKYFIQNLEGGVSVNASESESAEAEDFGVLKTSCVYNYYFDAKENKKVFDNEKGRLSCQVRKGAIIISRMNAPELVGASGLVLDNYPNLFLPDRLWQTVYRNNISFDPIWLSKIIITKGFRNYMTTFANGSSPSMKNISKGDFLNIKVPFSPKSEQTQIVSYLEEIEEKISKAILLKQQEIEKLKEYKTVLIDNVVTGKVRVS